MIDPVTQLTADLLMATVPLSWKVFVTLRVPAVSDDLPPREAVTYVVANFFRPHLWRTRRCIGRCADDRRASCRLGRLGRGQRKELAALDRFRKVALSLQAG
jgi:hypothetical protein